jgi:hypothetical protein
MGELADRAEESFTHEYAMEYQILSKDYTDLLKFIENEGNTASTGHSSNQFRGWKTA